MADYKVLISTFMLALSLGVGVAACDDDAEDKLEDAAEDAVDD